MPFTGTGMLVTSMDVDAADEVDFNRWYNTEHVAERVSIPGFLWAARYLAVNGRPKYLAFYETEALATLESPAYRKMRDNQTAWSRQNIARFRNMIRSCAQINVSLGIGHAAAVAVARVVPTAGRESELRDWLKTEELPALLKKDDIVSAHILESDLRLSRPLPGTKAEAAEFRDWFVVVEGNGPDVVAAACRDRFTAAILANHGGAKPVSFGVYRLLWSLSRPDWEASQKAAGR